MQLNFFVLALISLLSTVIGGNLRGGNNIKLNNNHKEESSKRRLTTYGWVQKGSELYGETHFAAASIVSLNNDGNILAVGAPGNNNGAGYEGGHVRVFEWNGSDWQQRGLDIDAESFGEQMGNSVSLSSDGSIVAIGAPAARPNTYYSGEARIYQWSGSSWNQMGDGLPGDDGNHFFGRSISLSANGLAVAVGANGANDNDGLVRVFDWSGSAWVQRGTDLIGDTDVEFGTSVSLNSNGLFLVIGLPYSSVNGNRSGAAVVYCWNGTAWVQMGSTILGDAEFDNLGEEVSISADGQTIAVGASGYDAGGSSRGLCRIFNWSGSSWVQVGGDIEGEVDVDNAGESIALSGDGLTVAVGAPKHDDGVTDNGQVKVYRFDGTAWQLIAAEIIGHLDGDELGFHVALNGDGTVVAAGAPKHDDNSLDSNGHALVFDLVDQTPTAVPTVAPTELVLQSAVIETPHPYPANMNSAWEVEFPDITCYDLTMHPKSYTPQDADYAKLFTISYNEGTKILTQIGSQALPPYRAMRLYKNRLHDFGTQQINAAGIRVEFVSDDAGSNYGLHLTITECSS